MDEIISRQAAIDSIRQVTIHAEDESLAVEALENLPSAQLEQAIKDCRNCKNGRYNDYHKTMFCYNSDDCTDWNLWEPAELPSAQPEAHEKRTETHGVCLDDLIKCTDAIDAPERNEND